MFDSTTFHIIRNRNNLPVPPLLESSQGIRLVLSVNDLHQSDCMLQSHHSDVMAILTMHESLDLYTINIGSFLLDHYKTICELDVHSVFWYLNIYKIQPISQGNEKKVKFFDRDITSKRIKL